MAKRIVISSGCMACGLCTTSPLLKELPDGTVKVKGTGIVTGRDEQDFLKIVNLCPAKIIALESVNVKTKAEICSLMDNKANAFSLPIPTEESIAFEKKHIEIHAPAGVPGQYRAEYSSYNRAKDAAMQAIDRAFFSQRKRVIQNIINDYRIDKLSKYYEYRESAENFYYISNQKAQAVLDEWIKEIQLYNSNVRIPEELLKVQSRPETKNDYVLKGIKEDLLYFADAILAELSDSCYSLSSYANYCDIDDQEEYAGSGMFGRSKYVTKYYFYNTSEAFNEMAKDLKWACELSFDERIVEPAYGCLKLIVEKYSQMLQRELKNKAIELKKLL